MLDDLRNSVDPTYDDDLADEERLLEQKRNRTRKSFLGMTPMQRFILSVILFLMVAIIGIILLIIMQRIVPPIS